MFVHVAIWNWIRSLLGYRRPQLSASGDAGPSLATPYRTVSAGSAAPVYRDKARVDASSFADEMRGALAEGIRKAEELRLADEETAFGSGKLRKYVLNTMRYSASKMANNNGEYVLVGCLDIDLPEGAMGPFCDMMILAAPKFGLKFERSTTSSPLLRVYLKQLRAAMEKTMPDSPRAEDRVRELLGT